MPGLKPFWFGRRCWSKTGWILFSIRRLVSLSTIGMILLLDHWFGLSPLMRRLLAKSSMISSRSNRLMTSGGILSGPAAFPSTILDFALSNSQIFFFFLNGPVGRCRPSITIVISSFSLFNFDSAPSSVSK